MFTVEGTSVLRRNRVFGAQLERGVWGFLGYAYVTRYSMQLLLLLCDKILNAVVVVFVVDDDDHFYVALFSALEQTHCARIRFCLRD